MKDKEKQIEEMAKDLHSTHAISSVCSGKDCNHCKYDSLKNFDEYTCIDLSLANDLYNAGYRKLPEDARVFIPDGQTVLLTREEYEKQKTLIHELREEIMLNGASSLNYKKAYMELNGYGKKDEIRKETAEKFYKKVKKLLKKVDVIVDGDEGLVGYEETAVVKGLTELAKQFCVEIKE